ncbi:helix-turn-helix domain-containing protein [Aureimonas psammosilenae]|uniref:helix-turn-helix domain-containing protein n=1 Tax=Aureimonas psammosilenae TaxID=2495496 RepID=UPI001F217336|nr:helix-turn-helix domain-containing protein [Aureimonas psammosilenae]
MSTTAARDDRLTPNAKAFLQVLRARCGKGRETTITKGTAGNIMARSPRTIRRYLVDLVRFGYIELSTRCNAQGLHLGLTVKLTALALPFFEDAKSLARWLAETPAALFRPFAAVFDPGKEGVTSLSPKNQTQTISSYGNRKKADASRSTARERLLRRLEASFVPLS